VAAGRLPASHRPPSEMPAAVSNVSFGIKLSNPLVRQPDRCADVAMRGSPKGTRGPLSRWPDGRSTPTDQTEAGSSLRMTARHMRERTCLTKDGGDVDLLTYHIT